MSATVLTTYMLVWPIVVAGVLYAVVRGFAKDVMEARREGRPLI